MRPLILLALPLALMACDKSGPPTEQRRAPATAHGSTHDVKRDPPPPSPTRAGKVKRSEHDGIKLTLSDVSVKAGGATRASIELQPTGPWKINTQYPTRISVSGMTYAVTPQLTFKSTDPTNPDVFRMTSGGIRIDVPFTGDAPGKDEVNATIRMGICQATCETREIDTQLTVEVTAPG